MRDKKIDYKRLVLDFKKSTLAAGISEDQFYKWCYDGMDMTHDKTIVSIRQRGYKNQDKLIALLRLPFEWIPTAGFYATFNRMLCGLCFADRLHFTPVVDRWVGSPYLLDFPIDGADNVFEYYFQRVSDITIDEAYESYNVMVPSNVNMDVVLAECGIREWYRPNDMYLKRMGSVYEKYIHLRPKIEAQMSADIENILHRKKTLGIHIRGTDFKGNWNLHPKALTVEDYIPFIQEVIEKYDMEQIFVATDDVGMVEAIRKVYPEVLFYQDVNRGEGETSVAFMDSEDKLYKYRLGYEVIRDAYTLAYCDYLIAGRSQVSIAARIIKASKSESYSYYKILDKGINYNNKEWMDNFKHDK